MTYAVRLDVYEGPLDLLLHLVSKESVDVAEISISSITEEYLREIRKLQEIDLEVASSFLVLAATLLELKSLKLLPDRGRQDPELAALLEERDHLLHRLIEYATFKGAAARIVEELERNLGFVSRSAEIPEEIAASTPDLLEGITLEGLSAAAAGALRPKPAPVVDTTHIAPIRVSVRETIDLIMKEMRDKRTATFSELCRAAAARIEVIVNFLALLELFRMNSVELEQSRPFGDIVVRWKEPRLGMNR